MEIFQGLLLKGIFPSKIRKKIFVRNLRLLIPTELNGTCDMGADASLKMSGLLTFPTEFPIQQKLWLHPKARQYSSARRYVKIAVLYSWTLYLSSLVAIVDAKRGIQERNKNKATPLQSVFPLSSDLWLGKFLSQNVNFVIVPSESFPSMNLSNCFIHNIIQEVVPQFSSTKLYCLSFVGDLVSTTFTQ